VSDSLDLLTAPIITILKQEISKLALTAHYVDNQDLVLGVSIENTAGARYDLPIAATIKFCGNFSRSGVLLKTLNCREHLLHQ
jgi:hypothetical protein